MFCDETNISETHVISVLKVKGTDWNTRRSVQDQTVLWLLNAIPSTLSVVPIGHIPCSQPNSLTPSSPESLQRLLEPNSTLKRRWHVPTKRRHKPITVQGSDTQETTAWTIAPPLPPVKNWQLHTHNTRQSYCFFKYDYWTSASVKQTWQKKKFYSSRLTCISGMYFSSHSITNHPKLTCIFGMYFSSHSITNPPN